MALILVLVTALVFGLVASTLKLPPMIGFLVAGFLLQGAFVGVIPAPPAIVELGHLPGLGVLADTGVTLLLFTIGLKLNLRSLLRPEVLGTAVAHMGFSAVLWAGIFWAISFTGLELFAGSGPVVFLLLGFALAFSSTIFVVKTLDEHGDTGARFGTIAIGVLIIQDLAAAVFMAAANQRVPSLWAVVLFVGLWPAKWLIGKIFDRVGRGELLIVTGILLALGGYQLFELVNLKGDLGAIVVGALVASHPRAKLLADRLFSLRELLLVGFFLSIGQYGLPDSSSLIVAFFLTLALPLQTLIYLAIFRFTRLRVRTGAKSALLLTNYSEFGLIAGIVAVKNGWLSEQWIVTLALSVTLSFIVATILNNHRSRFVNLLSKTMRDLPAEKLLPQERPVSFDNIDAVVFGMGDFGKGAYRRLAGEHGRRVRGIEQNLERVRELRAAGLDVIEGDATDPSLWERLHELHSIELVILAMPDHDGNKDALLEIQKSRIDAFVAVAADDYQELMEYQRHGADLVVDMFSGAGAELADEAERARRG